MPVIDRVVSRLRHNPKIDFALWCLIGLGMIPAIVTGSILPLGLFDIQFGVEIGDFVYLPPVAGLVAFAVGVVFCLAQGRYVTIILLLPWLALYVYDIETLTSQLPSRSQAQERLHHNRLAVHASGEVPVPSEICAVKARIVHAETEILPYVDSDVSARLGCGEDSTESSENPSNRNRSPISEEIADLSQAIDETEAQLKETEMSIKLDKLLSALGFGLNDDTLYEQLVNGLQKITGERDDLISNRNAKYARLVDELSRSESMKSDAIEELFDLHAEIETYLWVSESYRAWHLSLVYKSLCFLVLLVLAWKFSPGSWVFLSVLLASLLVSVLYVESPLWYSLWVVAKFFLIALVIRVLYLLYHENRPLIRNQSRTFLLRTAKTTLKFYWPFVLLIGFGIATSIAIDRQLDRQLFAHGILPDPHDYSHSRRYYVDIAINEFFVAAEEDAVAKLDLLSNQAELSVNDVAASTVDIFKDTFKPKLAQMNEAFEIPPCDTLLDWIFATGKCIEKEAKEPLSSSYSNVRDDKLHSLEQSTSQYASRTNDALVAIRMAKSDLREAIRAVRRSVIIQLDRFYALVDFYTSLSLLVLIIVTLKSLLYVYARVFFAAEKFDPQRAIQFEPNARPAQAGSIKVVSERLKLTARLGQIVYTNKDYDFANAPPDEVTPQAHKACFSRIRHRVWHMNKIWTAPRGKAKYAPFRRIPDDERIIVWTLKPGDAVIFSWRHFVGMNDAIRIRTQYSWQLSSLIFGRMFFVVASVDADSPADGKLLLRAKGHDGVDATINPSSSPDQFLAWQTTTRFELRANLTLRNVYRSSVQIKARGSDLAVTHLGDRRRRSGASAFLKYFLLPV